ncbi:MAG: hypothetical protein ABJD53_13440 [Gammaproteobacteria bacterium]
MRIVRKDLRYTGLPMAGATLALSIATLLGGCVVQERVAPPRPRAYAPPPPAYADQTYADPGSTDAEVRTNEAPPPLPDYDQPPCPEDGYLWTPGYWAWGGGGYYWIPGTWVQPPRVGVLWTPGYWGFVSGVYLFHGGYWGPHVGFYGGVNYGYGYGGAGFVGGRWDGNRYAYNRTVNNVNVTNIHNTYNETVINNVTVNRVSYNGGSGGVAAAPTAQDRAALHDRVAPTPVQRQHFQEAIKNPALAARANGGHPPIAATPRPAAFNAPGVIGARGAAAPRANNVTPPNVTHAPPNAGMQPRPPVNQPPQQGQTQRPGARPPAARPQPPKPQKRPAAKPPRNEKHEPER